METIQQITFGEAFRWYSPRTSVHRSCTINEGQGRIVRINIYISYVALMDALQVSATPLHEGEEDHEELENMAKRLWDKRIYPVVKRRINARDFDSDGTLQITTMEIGW
jgi:hypothetical protein